MKSHNSEERKSQFSQDDWNVQHRTGKTNYEDDGEDVQSE